MTSGEIYDAILAAHRPPEWACFPEVSNATGGRATRRIDALCCNLWPSRGLEMRAIEIKVGRGDLARELRDPSKAESIARFCHTFWLATPAGLVKPEELPLGWGLFTVGKGKLHTARKAVPRDPSLVAEPGRLFVAAIARAASTRLAEMEKSYIRPDAIADRLEAEFERGQKSAPGRWDRELVELQSRLDGVAPILAELDIDVMAESYRDRISKWDGEWIAKALRLGLALLPRNGTTMKHALDLLKRARDTTNDAITAIEELSLGEDDA